MLFPHETLRRQICSLTCHHVSAGTAMLQALSLVSPLNQTVSLQWDYLLLETLPSFFPSQKNGTVTYSTRVPHRGRGRIQEIQPGKIFGVKNVLKLRGQACDEKDLLFVANPVSAM